MYALRTTPRCPVALGVAKRSSRSFQRRGGSSRSRGAELLATSCNAVTSLPVVRSDRNHAPRRRVGLSDGQRLRLIGTKRITRCVLTWKGLHGASGSTPRAGRPIRQRRV